MTCSPKERTLWKLNIISTRQAITPPAPARPAACIVLNMPDATKLFGFKLNDYEENVYTLTTGHQLIRRNGTETNCRKKFYQRRSSAFQVTRDRGIQTHQQGQQAIANRTSTNKLRLYNR